MKLQGLVIERWRDRLWTIGLWLAALLMFCANLNQLPLRDWDEGIVAQVARDIYRAADGVCSWLYPTIAGQPYLNKPPVVHWLIAGMYHWAGVSEWTTRLPGAILTATSVPLLFGVGRELFPQRISAIFAALVYLTFLPIVRHGRLAMLDGAVLCFTLLLLFCLMRSRRDVRWGIGVGIGFGLLCLTKGLVALVIGAIAILFLIWDTPRLLTSAYLWLGMILGCLPALAWYWAQWQHYHLIFLQTNLLDQSLSRVWTPIGSNRIEPPWYYFLEILKYGWPWLLFLPQSIQLTWENREWGWAKLPLIWSGTYLAIVSMMSAKLPWYILPLYPALALMIGAFFTNVWLPEDFLSSRPPRPAYPLSWCWGLGLLAIASWSGSVFFAWPSSYSDEELVIICAAAAITLTVATKLVMQRDSQFIVMLLWGWYVALLLFSASHHWLWELNESYPVKPVAALIQSKTPPRAGILTTYPNYRPSLNFYSDRIVEPALPDTILQAWQAPAMPYLLTDPATLTRLKLARSHTLGQADGWILVTRTPDLSPVPQKKKD